MKHDDISDSSAQAQGEVAWYLDGLYAVNAVTNERAYVRALVDIGSYEFESSKLSNRQRLTIISSVGEPEIFRLMSEILVAKGYEYREENFKLDMALLLSRARRDVNP